MDISETIQPNSERVNADDLIGGPVTVRVTSVESGSAEQPVFIHTDVFEGRTYRPSKSMRRVLVSAWGAEAANYVGRSMTLFRNPDISFGREKVGGIQISAMSHIPRALTIPLTVSRGKKSPFTVQPLTVPDDTAIRAALDDIAQSTSINALKVAWELAGKRGVQGHPDVIAAKEARKVELS